MTPVVFALILLASFAPATGAQSLSCDDYDACEWAQAVYESDPDLYSSLDLDNDGNACPGLPRGGFAPAFWLDAIPEDVEEATIIAIIDGDTLEVELDGVSNRVRIYRADTPETKNQTDCGGAEATAFAEYALGFNDDPGTVYLERDKNTRDQYGRELAYVWFEVDGAPYMLNHILINNGWAEDIDYGDRLYDAELGEAAAFAEQYDLGVYDLCGGFNMPAAAPTPTPVPAPDPVAPAPEQPAPEPEQPSQNAGCDPNYTPCVPAYPPDLDCGEIGISVQVIGGDPHGFDRDGDGFGCESN
jgi:micrococcal nuclease